MNALEGNPITRQWRALSLGYETSRAILSISAHWGTKGVLIAAAKVAAA
ncbi:MAG: hypothetical protein ACHP7N_10130 [Caulobacterales bacterium]